MKNIIVKTHTADKTINEIRVITKDGQPTIIQADRNVNYEFFHEEINGAPNHIITKRVGEDLHISFEREGDEVDLIIQNFYEYEHNALIGIAENGSYYYYIPDTGEIEDYVTKLQAGEIEGQALGGENVAAPLWLPVPSGFAFPWWALIPLVPLLFIDKDKEPDTKGSTFPDEQSGTFNPLTQSNNPVTQKILPNDNNIDVNSLRLIDPVSGVHTHKVIVPGQGVWELKAGTDEVTFTPEKGFLANPTPLTYYAVDKGGNPIESTGISVQYPSKTTADRSIGQLGQPETVFVTSNDDGTIDETSLRLVDPNSPADSPRYTDTLVVPNEGTWTVVTDGNGKPTGHVTFTPNKDFTGDPTPIHYVVKTKPNGNAPVEELVPTPVAIEYPSPTLPDWKVGNKGQPVTQKVTQNDGNQGKDIDQTSVKLIDPKNPATTTDTVVVAGEGVWTLKVGTDEVTFTPENGFTGNPTPIYYVANDTTGVTLPKTTVGVGYPDVVSTNPNPDFKTGVPGQPVTQNVISNDGNGGNNIDPTSVKLVDPKTGTTGTSVTVPNEGVWTTTPTGDVTFTPNKDFTGDPTPITYTVKDKDGNDLPPTTVDVAYPSEKETPLPTPDSKTGVPGQPVTQNVTSNDGDNGKDIDPTSVKLVDPKTGTPGTSVTVPNEGVWTTTPTGDVTFTPNKDFTGDPTPITYTVTDKNGNTLPVTTVDVNYPSKQPTPLPTPDVKEGVPGQPVTQSVTSNDGDNGKDIDPTSVKLVDPNTGTTGTSVTVPNEGVWTTTPTGDVTFTPNKDFTGDPTPITYTVTDKNGNTLPSSTVDVNYPNTSSVNTLPDSKPGERGKPVSQNVLDNDGKNLDPSTVQLIDPNNPSAGGTDTVVIPNQGTWTVEKDPTGKPTGIITFTPNEGFEDDPAPINYIAKNPEGVTSKQTPVNVVYPKTPEVIVPDVNREPTPANPTGMGDNEVFEGNTAGVQGTFKVVPGLSSATITEISLTNESGTTVMVPLTVSPSAPVTFATEKGVLTINSYDATTGDVSYVFVPKVQNHSTDEPVLDKISIVAKDSNERQGYGILDIAITDGLPAANNDATEITEDATSNTVSGSLKPNDDFGADGQPTETTGYTEVKDQAAQYGSFTINADGTYTYALNNANPQVNALGNGQTLVDTIVYTITDKDGDTATAVLTVTINGVTDELGLAVGTHTLAEDAKETTDTTYAITYKAAAGMQSLTVNGEAVAVDKVINTTKGSLKILTVEDGKVTYSYTPKVLEHTTNGATEVDTFDVVLTDRTGATTNQKLTVNITDTVPTAANDTARITENAEPNTITGSLKDNDSFGADGQPTATTGYTEVTNEAGKYGSFTIKADGTYSYTLNNENEAVNALDNGETLVDTIVYTITDKDGDTSTAILTVTINGVTDELSLNTATHTLVESSAETFGEAYAITYKVDAGLQSLTVNGEDLTVGKVIDTPKGSLKVLTVEDGKVTYSYTPKVLQHVTDGQTEVDTLEVVLTDRTGAQTKQNVVVNITDTTPTAANDTARITEDATPNSVTGSLKGNDNFGPDGQPTETTGYTAVNNQAAQYGSFTIAADGTYTYVLDNANTRVNALNNGQTLVDTITYTITDKDGDTSTAILSVTISGATDELSLNTATHTLVEGIAETTGTEYAITYTAGAGVQSLTLKGEEVTAASVGKVIETDKGSLKILTVEDGKVTYAYTPKVLQHTTNGQTEVDTLEVVLTDRTGVKTTQNVVVNITDTTPTAANDTASINEDATPNTVTGSLKDNDNFGADGQPSATTGYTVVNNQAAKYGSFTIAANGNYTYTLNNANADVNALNDGQTLVDTITYTITDKDGDTSTAVLTVTINGRNEPTFSIVATVPEATEGTANNRLVFTVDNNGVPLTGNASAVVTLDAAASGAKLNADDIESITVTDGTNTRQVTFAQLQQGITVTTPANGTKPTITIVAKQDNVYEVSENVALKLSDAKYVRGNQALGITTATATGVILDENATEGDKPVVNLTGPATVPESIGNAVYTISMTNPSNENVTVTYTVTNGTTENNDFTGNVAGQTFTVNIPAGSTSVTVNVPIADNNIYEGPETYNVRITNVTGANKGTDTVTTTIYDNGTTNGTTPITPNTPDNGKDKPVITARAAHVSEEGLSGGAPDTTSGLTPNVDTTNATSATGSLQIANLENAAGLANNLEVVLARPTSISHNGTAVDWVSSNNGKTWTAYVKGAAQNEANRVLEVLMQDTPTVANGTLTYSYTANLYKQITHPQQGVEDNLNVNFDVTVSEKGTNIVLATQNATVTVVEDDMPAKDSVDHTIQVPHDTIILSSLQAGFINSKLVNNAGTITNMPTNVYTATDRVDATGAAATDGSRRYNIQAYGQNLDNDSLADKVAWGSTQDPRYEAGRAYYTMVDNTQLKAQGGFRLGNLEDQISLGVFTHQNSPTFEPYLASTTLRVQFGVNINGISVTLPNLDYEISHLETNNLSTTNFEASDFVLLKQSDKTVQIGTTTYRLVVDGFISQDGQRISQLAAIGRGGAGAVTEFISQAAADTEVNYTLTEAMLTTLVPNRDLAAELKAGGQTAIDAAVYAWGILTQARALQQLEFAFEQPANSIGRIDPGFDAEALRIFGSTFRTEVTNLNLASITNVGQRIQKAIDFLNQKDMVLVLSEERKGNSYDVKVHLEPLTPRIQLETNLTVLGKVRMGSDVATNVKVDWLGTVDNTNILKVQNFTANNTVTTSEANTVRTEITTKYGVLTGFADGSYNFSGADNLSDIVAAGATQEFTFNYRYADADGDFVVSDIKFNFEGLTASQMSTSRTIDKTNVDSNDYLIGSTQADTIKGGLGDDTIIGEAGADTLEGGRGNDVMFYDSNDVRIDGGAGDKDTLSFAAWLEVETDGVTPKIIDLTVQSNYNGITNFEVLDLTNDMRPNDGVDKSVAQTLKLNNAAAVSLSEVLNGSRTLFIEGDKTDNVQLTSNEFRSAGVETVNGKRYDVYTSNSVKLYIDDEINSVNLV